MVALPPLAARRPFTAAAPLAVAGPLGGLSTLVRDAPFLATRPRDFDVSALRLVTVASLAFFLLTPTLELRDAEVTALLLTGRFVRVLAAALALVLAAVLAAVADVVLTRGFVAVAVSALDVVLVELFVEVLGTPKGTAVVLE